MNSRMTPASRGVPGAPPTNGATGLPYRQRFSAYQSPPVAAAHNATTAALLKGRSPRLMTGHPTAAAAIMTPGYFAPAAIPANSPAAASSGRSRRPARQNAVAALAESSSRSSLADATWNPSTGAPSAMITAAPTCSCRSQTRRASALTTPTHSSHSRAVTAPRRSLPVRIRYASNTCCDCGHIERAWSVHTRARRSPRYAARLGSHMRARRHRSPARSHRGMPTLRRRARR